MVVGLGLEELLCVLLYIRRMKQLADNGEEKVRGGLQRKGEKVTVIIPHCAGSVCCRSSLVRLR